MTTIDRTELTATQVAEQAFKILRCQSRLLRCCWNAMKATPQADAEITFRLAAMMSTVGTALENIPQLAEDASLASIDGRAAEANGQRGWLSTSLEFDTRQAAELLSTLTVDPLWHPGLAESQYPYKHIRRLWKELCDRLAACAGVEANYVIPGCRSVEIEFEPELRFVRALSREAGWLRRRSKSFARHVTEAWTISRLARGPSTMPFADEMRAVHLSGASSLKSGV